MSNPIPSQLSLTNIADGSLITAAPHRNNYAAIQAAVNEIIAALSNGTAGQYLQAVDASDVQWATPPSAPVASVFGRTGAVVATSGDYSVSQVTGAAPLANPAFTGTPTAPTPPTADNSTQVATTAYVKNQTQAVTSVFGRTGAVTAAGGDYTAAQVTNAADKSSNSTQAFAAQIWTPSYLTTANSLSGAGPLALLPNLLTGGYWVVTQTSGANQISILAPTNVPGTNQSTFLLIEVRNTTAGALGILWNAAYVSQTDALPANVSANGRVAALFVYDPVDNVFRMVGLF